MSDIVDLTGQQFGRWTVVERLEKNRHGHWQWKCRCSCGVEAPVNQGDLRQGKSTCCKTCRADKLRVANPTKTDQVYYVWIAMRMRCSNPNDKRYADYGGRGIKVCERWENSYAAFCEDMGPRPKGRYSIERADTDGDYEPGNCHWDTDLVQSRNKRNNVWVEIDGEQLLLKDALERYNLPAVTYYKRIKKGWDRIDAITTPGYKARRLVQAQ